MVPNADSKFEPSERAADVFGNGILEKNMMGAEGEGRKRGRMNEVARSLPAESSSGQKFKWEMIPHLLAGSI